MMVHIFLIFTLKKLDIFGANRTKSYRTKSFGGTELISAYNLQYGELTPVGINSAVFLSFSYESVRHWRNSLYEIVSWLRFCWYDQWVYFISLVHLYYLLKLCKFNPFALGVVISCKVQPFILWSLEKKQTCKIQFYEKKIYTHWKFS